MKNLFYDGYQFVEYATKIINDVFKFLYWRLENGEEVLLTCSRRVETHEHLAKLGVTYGIIPEKSWPEGKPAWFNKDEIIPVKPDGAGSMKKGEIVSWISGGFMFKTPAALQDRIEELLLKTPE